MVAKKLSKTERLKNFFIRAFNGNFNRDDITAAQAYYRFGIRNLSATVSTLRLDHGLAIYANQKTAEFGNKFTSYRMGLPSRKVVATGYRVLGTASAHS